MQLQPELLLHPNIPKPLHGLNPRTILGQQWWDNTRRKAYAEQDYCCLACGVHKSNALFHSWLEGHEFFKIDYVVGYAEVTKIVALCHACHNYIHSGRMRMLVDKGQMSIIKMADIIQYGERILDQAGLPYRVDPPTVVQQDWSKWYLLLEGIKYYSPYKNIEDWVHHYS